MLALAQLVKDQVVINPPPILILATVHLLGLDDGVLFNHRERLGLFSHFELLLHLVGELLVG